MGLIRKNILLWCSKNSGWEWSYYKRMGLKKKKKVWASLASMLLPFQWNHYLVNRHMVKPAGSSSDFMRVSSLWLSLGKAGSWGTGCTHAPPPIPHHSSFWLGKLAFWVSSHETFSFSHPSHLPHLFFFTSWPSTPTSIKYFLFWKNLDQGLFLFSKWLGSRGLWVCLCFQDLLLRNSSLCYVAGWL